MLSSESSSQTPASAMQCTPCAWVRGWSVIIGWLSQSSHGKPPLVCLFFNFSTISGSVQGRTILKLAMLRTIAIRARPARHSTVRHSFQSQALATANLENDIEHSMPFSTRSQHAQLSRPWVTWQLLSVVKATNSRVEQNTESHLFSQQLVLHGPLNKTWRPERPNSKIR